MTLEDFTTYTEVDPNNHISVASSTHVDVNVINEGEDAYLYDDKGVDHFEDFVHNIDIKAVTHQSTTGEGCCWVLANIVDDWRAIYNGGGDLLSVLLIWYAPGEWRLYLQEVDGGSYYATYQVISQSTWYYLTIERSGTSLTCKAYSDSARTNLLFTLSLTLHTPITKFRYIYAVQSDNKSWSTYWATYDVENLDLGEIPIVPIIGLRNLLMEEEWR